MKRPRPFVLIILDGWGHREHQQANAIALANKPHWDNLWQNYPHTLITASGQAVGLPEGQMGNSEVGHLNMGAGRIVYQGLTRIDKAIADESFFTNPVLIQALTQANKNKKNIHILGLLSPGGIHSHEKHLHALLELAAKKDIKNVYIHAILDGRDTPPRSAEKSLIDLEALCNKLHCGTIASIIGRYYAMDRDKRWDRVQKAYDLLTSGKADFYTNDPVTGLKEAYERKENDEFVKPTSIIKAPIQDGDIVFFINFRADRARQLTRALIDPEFNDFTRDVWPHVGSFVTFTQYDKNLPTQVVFPPETLNNILGSYLSQLGFKQLRLAETEKYAHVTFFFNGGIEKPFPGEERLLIPSAKVATYDLLPEMSAHPITETLVNEIRSNKYDFIVCNYANPDMVGHTGDLDATIKAIETVDSCIGQVLQALHDMGGEALITADHGNAEVMFDEKTGQPHTAHTCELVPLVYFGRKATPTHPQGIMADIAPTLLYLLNLPIPKEMTGQSLFELKKT